MTEHFALKSIERFDLLSPWKSVGSQDESCLTSERTVRSSDKSLYCTASAMRMILIHRNL